MTRHPLMPEPRPRGLWTLPEAAAELRFSRRTLERLIKAGRIRVVHPSPGRTAITHRELDAYMASIERRGAA